MKKILFFLLFSIFCCEAFAAVDDGITLTGCTTDSRYNPYVRKCTVHWANDTGTDIGPTSISIDPGRIIAWETDPDGTNAPTADYDVKVLRGNSATTSVNLIQNITDQSATVNGGDFPLFGGAYGAVWQNGTIYPYVSGLTDSNDEEGDLIIWVDTRRE